MYICIYIHICIYIYMHLDIYKCIYIYIMQGSHYLYRVRA